MKLFYYSPVANPAVPADFRNFGDDLNSSLWKQLFPNVFGRIDDSVLFSGIGSHLNAGFATQFKRHRHVVFGTGYGYGKPIGQLNGQWKVYFVRGPITAESIGLPESAAITDAAMLLRLLQPPNLKRVRRVAVMPHVDSITAGLTTWKALCDDLGFHLIDVRAPLGEILVDLGSTQLLLTEALHGAIVADALRTPWIPLASYPTISQLKWQDWCLSIGVYYEPIRLPPVWHSTARPSFLSKTKRFVKFRLMRRRLARVASDANRYLSTESRIHSLTAQMADAAARLERDCSRGTLFTTSSLSVHT